MGSEGCFPTNEDLDQQILRSPWADYPLPPLHKACRDGDVQSLLYLVIQGDRLGVFRSVNEQDQFLMWTPAHWAAYFGQVGNKISLKKLVNFAVMLCQRSMSKFSLKSYKITIFPFVLLLEKHFEITDYYR